MWRIEPLVDEGVALIPECQHVYKILNTPLCHYCGLPTHEVDWMRQNKLMKQWKIDHPDAQYEGWMSI